MTVTATSVNPGIPASSKNQTPSSVLSSSGDTSTASTQLAGNFDNFLKLLTTQLSNQDPLSPLDATQFTTQLAQFSGVEQAINTNKKLDTLIAAQTTGQLDTGVNFLGKIVEGVGDVSALTNGQAQWGYGLATQAATTQIQIFDSQGHLVRSIPGETTAGGHVLNWDGKDDSGNTVPDGNYQMQIMAKDSDGKDVSVTTHFLSPVNGVATQNGQVMLQTSNGLLSIGNVISVRQPTPAPAA